MNESPLLFSRNGHFARIRFNQPATLNAIESTTARLFLEAVKSIAEDHEIRVVVLDGTGRAFVSGADLRVIISKGITQIGEELIDPLHEAVALLSELEVPVIASVNGVVAGAGLSLAMACDLVIASEDAQFTLAYINIGASCDASASWTLPRLLGLRKALELAILNTPLDASEALRLGLVNWVVPAGELAERTAAIVDRIVRGPPVALGHMKRLIRNSLSCGLREQLANERASFLACAATTDFMEALHAFFQKRPPRFEGR